MPRLSRSNRPHQPRRLSRSNRPVMKTYFESEVRKETKSLRRERLIRGPLEQIASAAPGLDSHIVG